MGAGPCRPRVRERTSDPINKTPTFALCYFDDDEAALLVSQDDNTSLAIKRITPPPGKRDPASSRETRVPPMPTIVRSAASGLPTLPYRNPQFCRSKFPRDFNRCIPTVIYTKNS
jgi:hypothetical protein